LWYYKTVNKEGKIQEVMNRRLIGLGIAILIATIFIRLLITGIQNLKVDEFHPVATIFVIDASASNQKDLVEQKKFLRQMCAIMDPEDQIKILRVSQSSYLIYEGSPQNGSDINKAMNAFTQYNQTEVGTAYGLALKKAFTHALAMKKDGYTPCIVVMGDLANEGKSENQINWDTLPQNVANVQKYAPDLSMVFLFASPEKLDLVKEKLSPVLGEEKLIISPEQNVDKTIRKFTAAIGR
jgi:hypothetical protein